MKKILSNSKIWSNVFFIIPFVTATVIAIIYQDWLLFIHAIIIACVITFSSLYHYNGEKEYAKIDQIFAISLVVYNLMLCAFSLTLPNRYFYLALVFVVVALYFMYWRKKDDWEWHLSSAVITTFCILEYIEAGL